MSEELKERIKAIFEKHDHQQDVLVDIYKIFFLNWDEIEKIRGWPSAGEALWEFVCRLFQDFDEKHHPEVLSGGAWMNWGFSIDKNLGDWDVSLDTCQVILKGGQDERESQTGA
jgi:hypothetical protein